MNAKTHWRPSLPPTRVFIDSAVNPVPRMPSESGWDYSQRIIASGKSAEWQAAKEAWGEAIIAEQLTAKFGQQAARSHLRNVARFNALHPISAASMTPCGPHRSRAHRRLPC